MKDIRSSEHFQKVYIRSHFRITTYLIGIATAYIYLLIKNSKFKFSVVSIIRGKHNHFRLSRSAILIHFIFQTSRTIGFFSAICINISCCYMAGFLYLPGVTYNPWLHVLYFTIQRILFSLTISYLIIVSALSNFGN